MHFLSLAFEDQTTGSGAKAEARMMVRKQFSLHGERCEAWWV